MVNYEFYMKKIKIKPQILRRVACEANGSLYSPIDFFYYFLSNIKNILHCLF